MVEVKVGTVLAGQTRNKRSGTSSKGPWVMYEVKAEKGYDTIKVWISNIDDIIEGADLTITEILSAKVTNRKCEKDGQEKWATDFNIQVKIKAEEPDVKTQFTQMDDDDCPF